MMNMGMSQKIKAQVIVAFGGQNVTLQKETNAEAEKEFKRLRSLITQLDEDGARFLCVDHENGAALVDIKAITALAWTKEQRVMHQVPGSLPVGPFNG